MINWKFPYVASKISLKNLPSNIKLNPKIALLSSPLKRGVGVCLNEMGTTVLRYKNDDVINNIEGVLEDIKDCINRIKNKHTP